MKAEYITHMGDDLMVANVARVSFAKESKEFTYRKDMPKGSDEGIIEYLAKHNHWTPFGHPQITLRMKAPVPIRTQCFKSKMGFCLAGDTEIYFEKLKDTRNGVFTKTIKDLYDKWNTPTPHGVSEFSHRERIKKLDLRTLDCDTDDFTRSHISNVIFSGYKNVYEIELEDGKKVSITSDHMLHTEDGWMSLKDAVGLTLSSSGIASMSKEAYIATNGVSVEGSEQTYKNFDWLKEAKDFYGDLQGIANAAGCSTHTIRKWLKRFDLQFDPLKNLKGVNGEPPWNKGLKGYSLENYTLSEEGREAIRKSRSGENSNFWKGGVTSERANITRWTKEQAKNIHKSNNFKCVNCGSSEKLETHHIVPVYADLSLAKDASNLTTLCQKCHRHIHGNHLEEEFAKNMSVDWKSDWKEKPKGRGNTLVAKYQKIVKITAKGRQEVYDLTVEHKDHNFVGNGIVLHNCENEESRRYISSTPEVYIPDHFRCKPSGNAKQGSEGVHPESDFWLGKYKELTKNAVATYIEMVEDGVAPEQARFILPQGCEVNWIWTGSLAAFARFFNLRKDSHAQKEVQDLAFDVGEIIFPLFPVAWKALTD